MCDVKSNLENKNIVREIDDGSLAFLFKDYKDDGLREDLIDFGEAIGAELYNTSKINWQKQDNLEVNRRLSELLAPKLKNAQHIDLKAPEQLKELLQDWEY